MKYDIMPTLSFDTQLSLESFFEMKYDIIPLMCLSNSLPLESFFEMKYDIMSSLYFLVQQGNTDISLKKN